MASSPDFTYTGKNSSALKSDSYKTQYVDLYGVFAEKNTRSQDTVKLWYPDDQMTMNFFVLGPNGAVATQGAAAGGAVKEQTSVKTAVAKLDTDVTDADKNNDNVIIVGGPAVNTLVSDLATAGKTKDLNWYLSQGEGTAIIDFVADAWGTGKAALVVAGYSAADTKSVTGILLNYDSHATDLTGTTAVFKNGVLSTTPA
jgi:S-layer protein (TIGR01564 family)